MSKIINFIKKRKYFEVIDYVIEYNRDDFVDYNSLIKCVEYDLFFRITKYDNVLGEGVWNCADTLKDKINNNVIYFTKGDDVFFWLNRALRFWDNDMFYYLHKCKVKGKVIETIVDYEVSFIKDDKLKCQVLETIKVCKDDLINEGIC